MELQNRKYCRLQVAPPVAIVVLSLQAISGRGVGGRVGNGMMLQLHACLGGYFCESGAL